MIQTVKTTFGRVSVHLVSARLVLCQPLNMYDGSIELDCSLLCAKAGLHQGAVTFITAIGVLNSVLRTYNQNHIYCTMITLGSTGGVSLLPPISQL